MSKPPDTYFTRQLETDDEEAGGRYAKAKDRPTIITGLPSDPLPVAEWSKEVVPQEEPLGTDIESVPDMNTVSEGIPDWRQRSLPTLEHGSAPGTPPAPANSGFRPFLGDAVEREASAPDDFPSDDEEQ